MGIGIGAAIFGGAALSAGGSIFSGIMGAKGSKEQAGAIRYSADVASRTALELNERARGDLAPFRGYGVKAGDTLLGMLTGGQDVSSTLRASPLFQWQEQEGSRMLNRQLSARGLQTSGAGLETLARFSNQLMAEEGQRFYDRLYNLTALGGNAAAQMATTTNQTGTSLANLQGQMGMAQAGAIGQQYNAYGSAIGGTLQGLGGDIAGIPMYNASMGLLNRMGGGNSLANMPAVPNYASDFGAAGSMQAQRLGLTGTY